MSNSAVPVSVSGPARGAARLPNGRTGTGLPGRDSGDSTAGERHSVKAVWNRCRLAPCNARKLPLWGFLGRGRGQRQARKRPASAGPEGSPKSVSPLSVFSGFREMRSSGVSKSHWAANVL